MTRVLVVDDDPHILRTLRIHLTARGYTVTTAQTGREALRAGADTPPDVVVLDLGLPDLDGVAVITELRRWSTVPIIVLSARTDAADKIRALDTGADDYVTKPFGMPELLARMRAALRRSTGSPVNGDPVVETPTSPSTSQPKRSPATQPRYTSPPPSGASSNCSCATAVLSWPNANSSPKCGAPPTAPRPTTYASTSHNYAASSNPTRPDPATSSLNPVWATALQTPKPIPLPAQGKVQLVHRFLLVPAVDLVALLH